MTRHLSLAALIGSLVVGSVPASSQSRQPVVLRGIKVVVVDYGVFGGTLPSGLDTATIRTRMELELRRAGLTVSAFSPSLSVSTRVATPMVSFRLTTLNVPSGVAVSATLNLTEVVTMPRLPSRGFAATWEARPVLLWAPPAATATEVMRVLQQQLDEFVNAYLSVNPRAPSLTPVPRRLPVEQQP